MTTRCGYIAIIGRPNVGKSTLLNKLIDQKISITSRKPQTTRHRIIGIDTQDQDQLIYVDTPGIHRGEKKAINKMMNQAAKSVLHDVDAIVFVVDGTHWREDDDYVLQLLEHVNVPCFLIVNKVDKITDKDQLLPWLEKMGARYSFAAMIPVSAKTGVQLDVLRENLRAVLPESAHFYAEDDITDRPIRFLCAEMLREKIFRLNGQELPYATTVGIESYQDEGTLVRIHALILVDKESHKRMIIGDKGAKLKMIATSARLDMEQLIGKKVFLSCFCKVKSGWSDDENMLIQLGYDKH